MFDVGNHAARPQEAANTEITQKADRQQNKRKGEKQRILRAQINHESEDPVAHATDHQHVRVVEQRPHKLDIDIRGDAFGLCFAHMIGPTLSLVMPQPP
ncbi:MULTISPECIES: DUF604 domain-containing protein [unclassified Mesorhizobium]|uniref:DUF604 domain-containing protein n=1 Tax=unclassified Mesorhizobium TaxID=325217 RepID=UPI001FDA3923|nr:MULTISPECIES: DUF604 domain-containing protein [unclassified Mesorhizobium]